jgi:hypothetical protein
MPAAQAKHALTQMFELQSLFFEDDDAALASPALWARLAEEAGLPCSEESLAAALQERRATEATEASSSSSRAPPAWAGGIADALSSKGFAVVYPTAHAKTEECASDQPEVAVAAGAAAAANTAQLCAAVASAIAALEVAGLPPAFALAFDATWLLFDAQLAWLEQSRLLDPNPTGEGGGCGTGPATTVLIEPDMNCWQLRREPAPPPLSPLSPLSPPTPTPPAPGAFAKALPHVGGNFGAPHRDLRHDQCHAPATGRPTALSVWVSVNPSGATAANGAMRCVYSNSFRKKAFLKKKLDVQRVCMLDLARF